MPSKEYQRYQELNDRSCDALVLSYSPYRRLVSDCDRSFYIPSQGNVEESFGESLRKLLGETKGSSHWADSVRWNNIEGLDKLERRILEGTRKILIGPADYRTPFENYLSELWGKFEHAWIYGRGDFYRFRKGRRAEALEKFKNYWTPKEKVRWEQIHTFMGEHTQKILRIPINSSVSHNP